MYWTLELVNHLEDAPWPATKDELIEFSIRTGAPAEVTENLQELEDDGAPYESIEEIWPDYPTKDDFFFNRVPSLGNERSSNLSLSIVPASEKEFHAFCACS